jgi:hypothetical protein
MKGVVHTVLSGSRIEELPLEVIAVMENALGPGSSMILARLEGERAEFTGVAAGMSGSPVYVDGRLVGALAYRIGIFTKEPIAGITPIEYMLQLGSGTGEARTARRGTISSGLPASLPSAAREGIPLAMDLTGPGPVAGTGFNDMILRPIETPLVVTGIAPEILREFGPQFQALGAVAVAGSGGAPGGAASSSQAEPEPVRPGDAISLQLVRGDLNIAASGTVTHVEGERVLAFGHGLLQSGPTDFPMARAEVYLTLASDAGSTKFVRILDTIGTWEDIRLTGSAGDTSRVPDMVPLTVTVRMPSESRTFSYDVARHRDWTPLLVAMSVAGSLANTPNFSNESTLNVSSRIHLEGHPDVVMENLYTGLGRGASAALAGASDIHSVFAAVFQNRFEEAVVRSVEVTAEGIEEGRISFVEGVWPSRTEASPGDEVRYHLRIRSYRGHVEMRTFTFRVPEQTPRGTLRVVVGGGGYLAGTERGILNRQVGGADSLDQIISVVNDLRRGDALYAKALRRLPGAVVQSEVLPALPPSILTTLRSNRGSGEVATMAETTVWEDSLEMDSVVVGGAALSLKIR